MNMGNPPLLYLLSGEKRNEKPIFLGGLCEGQGGRKWAIGPAMLVEGDEEVVGAMREDLEVVPLGARSHPILLKVTFSQILPLLQPAGTYIWGL